MWAMGYTKDERLAEFFRRLGEAPSVGSAAEAIQLLARTLNDLEDEMTDIPADTTTWATDGRMYPIQEDNWRDEPNGNQRGRSRSHNTFIGRNGAIEIRLVSSGALVFSKPGVDGQGLPS